MVGTSNLGSSNGHCLKLRKNCMHNISKQPAVRCPKIEDVTLALPLIQAHVETSCAGIRFCAKGGGVRKQNTNRKPQEPTGLRWVYSVYIIVHCLQCNYVYIVIYVFCIYMLLLLSYLSLLLLIRYRLQQQTPSNHHPHLPSGHVLSRRLLRGPGQSNMQRQLEMSGAPTLWE